MLIAPGRITRTLLVLLAAATTASSGSAPAARTGEIVAEIEHATVSAIAVDGAGGVYAVGTAGSNGMVTTPNAVKRVCSATDQCFSDAVLARFSAEGTLAYATYLGGTSNETAQAIAVDREGNMYVGGTTWSADFPVTRAIVPPQAAQQGFVIKLDRDGRITASTTIGGEGVNAIAVDATGDVYVAGFAYTPTVPMVGAIQPVIHGAPDSFVAKLSPDLARVVSSTYLGGSRADVAMSMALESGGSVVLGGITDSPDFPTVRAARDGLGGVRDGFVARLAADGRLWEFATPIGGSHIDAVFAVAVDPQGSIYAAGTTESPDFPVTDGAFDGSCGSDGACDPHQIVVRGIPSTARYLDGFVASLTPVGGWRFSTFLGGRLYDESRALAFAPDGAVVVAGFSTSPDFAARGRLACPRELSCPPFVVRLRATGAALTGFDRMPFAASYAPMFDAVALAVDRAGGVLMASSFAGKSTIARVLLDAPRAPVIERRGRLKLISPE